MRDTKDRFPEFVMQGGEIVDTATGDVVDQSQFDGANDLVVPDREEPLAALVRAAVENDGKMPLHIAKMQELGISTAVASSFFGVRPTPVSEVLDKVFEVDGAIVYFSGPYASRKKQNPDGSPYIESGYYKILLRTTATKNLEIKGSTKPIKQRIVLATSGKSIAQTVLAMIDQWGWYTFKDGHTEWVVFSCEEPGASQLMYVLEGKPE